MRRDQKVRKRNVVHDMIAPARSGKRHASGSTQRTGTIDHFVFGNREVIEMVLLSAHDFKLYIACGHKVKLLLANYARRESPKLHRYYAIIIHREKRERES